ncbi:MAG: DNA-binding protein [Bacteroidetes bacterium RIFCSPLOWO2_12_FULL_31_6]|nr:MAG: DNA-binding protein [Bacteroidetes bacterium RIFCSPLOWO2_12_FULL_31_6]
MSSNIKIPKICLHCENAFIAKTTVTKFCSNECAGKAYKLKKKKEKIKKVQKEEFNKSVGFNMEFIQAKEFLSVKEACLLLGISRMTLYRHIRNNTIIPSKIGGKVIIKREVINEILN